MLALAVSPLLLVRSASADDGDETLRSYLERADLVLDVTLEELDGPFNTEIGVAHYSATCRVNEVLAGARPTETPVRAEIVRYETKAEDRLPCLEEGARVVLFLRAQAPSVPPYTTADMWFGVQPYNASLVRSLKRLGKHATNERGRRMQWVEQCMRDLESVHAGMTRAEVEKRFPPDGGLQGVGKVRYVHPDCPYFKVDVEYLVQKNHLDRATPADDDPVTQVSKPYLERPIAD